MMWMSLSVTVHILMNSSEVVGLMNDRINGYRIRVKAQVSLLCSRVNMRRKRRASCRDEISKLRLQQGRSRCCRVFAGRQSGTS